ncbi:MAG: ferrous iron transport protein A [Rickettsiales bacterium]|nr:ferrous iron transport protein A [Rickettsiales bacterium]
MESCSGCSKACSRSECVVKLSDVPVGGSGLIIDILAENNTKLRIMELGLVRATRLEVINKSPLGDPISIRVRGYQLMLRKKDAETIIVKKIASNL